jgi:hypothetical protein
MKKEKSLKKQICTGLAALAASAGIGCGATVVKEAEGPVLPVGEPKIIQVTEITPDKVYLNPDTENAKDIVVKEHGKDKDGNETQEDVTYKGLLTKTGLPLIDDGIQFHERRAAGRLLMSKVNENIETIDSEKYVVTDFRWYENKECKVMISAGIAEISKADNISRRFSMPEEKFKEYVAQINNAMVPFAKSIVVPASAESTSTQANAGAAAPAVAAADSSMGTQAKPVAEPTAEPTEKANGLEYVVREGKTYVKMPGSVGTHIDAAEDKKYCLGLLKKTERVKHVYVEVEKVKDADDKYVLVAEYESENFSRKTIDLKKIHQIYAHITARDKLDSEETSARIAEATESVIETAHKKDDSSVSARCHNLNEYRRAFEYVESAKKSGPGEIQHARRVLEELMRGFRPIAKWYFEEKNDDGTVIQRQGPRSYAKLAEYVKSKDEKLAGDDVPQEKVQEAIDALTYEIKFVPGGPSVFQIVVKDKDTRLGSWTRRIEESNYYGGNAESAIERILESAGHKD